MDFSSHSKGRFWDPVPLLVAVTRAGVTPASSVPLGGWGSAAGTGDALPWTIGPEDSSPERLMNKCMTLSIWVVLST